MITAAAAKSLQSCPTLCDPMDCSLPGFSVHGILQARTLEWVTISFSNAWKWKVKVKSFSRVWLLATPWTAAYQAPPSMGFSGQQYWSRVPLPSPNEWLSCYKSAIDSKTLWKCRKSSISTSILTMIILKNHITNEVKIFNFIKTSLKILKFTHSSLEIICIDFYVVLIFKLN